MRPSLLDCQPVDGEKEGKVSVWDDSAAILVQAMDHSQGLRPEKPPEGGFSLGGWSCCRFYWAAGCAEGCAGGCGAGAGETEAESCGPLGANQLASQRFL